ncbi:MAG TPA: hypothetical protein VK624_05425 [Steroidobacteraceae bacterium]|jgi:hypothetical protein|nr:hypothetical protein [Steroidobacteraceae bacterium]
MTTGEFDFTRFSQRGTAPGVALPAEPLTRAEDNVRVISSLEEMRAAVDAVALSAQRLMSIYTPDLEPDLYDQNAFLEIVKRFVLARRFAKVRVLLSDSGRLLRDNNRFIAMGRRLTSCIDIRPAAGVAKQRACGYLIADDRAIVYRVHSDRWDGVADLNNPPVARQYLDEFDEIWHASAADEASRQAIR